jgi:hypothetical protein
VTSPSSWFGIKNLAWEGGAGRRSLVFFGVGKGVIVCRLYQRVVVVVTQSQALNSCLLLLYGVVGVCCVGRFGN